MASSRRSGRELGRVALPTVQRRLALYGKLCFNSLWPVTNVTGQGNGLRSWFVREERGGPGITVKGEHKRKVMNAPYRCFANKEQSWVQFGLTWPISGLPPAPRPRVSWAPICSCRSGGALDVASACGQRMMHQLAC